MEHFGRDGGNRQSKKGKGKDFEKEEEAYEETKLAGVRSFSTYCAHYACFPYKSSGLATVSLRGKWPLSA